MVSFFLLHPLLFPDFFLTLTFFCCSCSERVLFSLISLYLFFPTDKKIIFGNVSVGRERWELNCHSLFPFSFYQYYIKLSEPSHHISPPSSSLLTVRILSNIPKVFGSKTATKPDPDILALTNRTRQDFGTGKRTINYYHSLTRLNPANSSHKLWL